MPDPAAHQPAARPSAPVPASAREAALLARAGVAGARLATLVTYARHPGGQHSTAVEVAPRGDGSVEVRLTPGAHAVRLLLARPLATVSLAPPGSPPVLLHGAARRLPGTTADGRVVFHVEAAAVRIGEHCRPVDPRDYAACAPDAQSVLRRQAAGVLAHLDEAHADLLLARVRAAGLRAEFGCASDLDASGLTVLAVSRMGVEAVRLPFPEPITSAQHLPAALAGVLRRRCDCGA